MSVHDKTSIRCMHARSASTSDVKNARPTSLRPARNPTGETLHAQRHEGAAEFPRLVPGFGPGDHEPAVAAAGPYAYVASNFDATASVVDLGNTSAAPTQLTVTTPRNPGFYGSALSGKDGMLYLSADYDEAIYQFNTTTRTFVRPSTPGAGNENTRRSVCFSGLT